MLTIKNNEETTGTYPAEVCKIVGIFLMWQLKYLFDINNMKHYRDNDVILLRKKYSKSIDKPRKELLKFFKDPDLKIFFCHFFI